MTDIALKYHRKRKFRNAIYAALIVGFILTVIYGSYRVIDKVVFAQRLTKGF